MKIIESFNNEFSFLYHTFPQGSSLDLVSSHEYRFDAQNFTNW